jgi:YbbR domain-containing protein
VALVDKWLGNKNVLRIFSLCIGILLWYGVQYGMQTKLSTQSAAVASSERTIQNVAIRAVGLDANVYSLQGMSSSYVTVKLRGTKTVLNQFNVADSNTRIVADLTNVHVGTRKVYLEARGYPDNIDVVIQPNYITVDVEKIGEKEKPVTIEPKGEVAAGYQLESMTASPEKVNISGLQSKVNQVASVTVQVDVSDLSGTLVGDYSLVAKNKNGTILDVTMTPARVQVKATSKATGGSPSPTTSTPPQG